MRLTEVYTTWKGGNVINTVNFEGKDFSSVSAAYAECIDHAVECLKAGDAEITEVCCNYIHYKMDDEEYADTVALYDEDGELLHFESGHKTTLFRVTTTFIGADKPSEFFFDTLAHAEMNLAHLDNGEVEKVVITSDYIPNFWNGCTLNDMTCGDSDVYIKVA